MCLAIPGRVTTLFEQNGIRMGMLDFGGVKKEVCLACTPDIEIGDYAIVHAGFAIGKLDEVAALDSLRDFQSMEGAAP